MFFVNIFNRHHKNHQLFASSFLLYMDYIFKVLKKGSSKDIIFETILYINKIKRAVFVKQILIVDGLFVIKKYNYCWKSIFFFFYINIIVI